MRANVWICELVSVWMYVCACAFEYERYCLFKGEDVSIQISLVYREQISISSDKNSEYYTCLRASFFSFYGNFSLDVLFHRSLHWLLCFVYPGPVLDSLLVDYLYRCYWYWYCGSLSSTMKFPSYSFILFKHFFFVTDISEFYYFVNDQLFSHFVCFFDRYESFSSWDPYFPFVKTLFIEIEIQTRFSFKINSLRVLQLHTTFLFFTADRVYSPYHYIHFFTVLEKFALKHLYKL